MPTVIATHDVKDTDHWLSPSSKRAEIFATVGVTDIRTFVNPENRNSVGLIMEVPDLAAVQALLETAEGQAAAAADGVDLGSLRIYLEE